MVITALISCLYLCFMFFKGQGDLFILQSGEGTEEWRQTASCLLPRKKNSSISPGFTDLHVLNKNKGLPEYES